VGCCGKEKKRKKGKEKKKDMKKRESYILQTYKCFPP